MILLYPNYFTLSFLIRFKKRENKLHALSRCAEGARESVL